MKTKFFFMAILLSVLSICNIAYPQATQHEEVTLTTYYPAPYGDYVELTVSGNAASPALDVTPTLTAAANNDILTALRINPIFNDLGFFNVQHNGLVVESGNVGIGTTSPGAKLDVQGGAIKATGGLIIETRTSDPATPVEGQLWLRTDI